ncbi:hypothetical protein V1478_002428 [Vespula squamosa]|uniref:Uncharacterized protein n=1 Tax=Vespula squamosa TaxID=30214 RepID=A0ABD2BAE1_VESSQ
MMACDVKKKEEVSMTHRTKLFNDEDDEEDDDVFITSSTRYDTLVYLESKEKRKRKYMSIYLMRGEHTLNYIVTVSGIILSKIIDGFQNFYWKLKTINQLAGFKGKINEEEEDKIYKCCNNEH